MSAHTRLRKVFNLCDGSQCSVEVLIHNLDPKESDGIVGRVMAEAQAACQDVKDLLQTRDQTEAQARADRLAALKAIVDPAEKVISHGSAELHNAPQVDAPTPVVKAKKGAK